MNEDLAHLRRLIEQHQKNIRRLEENLALHGADQPLFLVNSLELEQEALAQAQEQMKALLSGSIPLLEQPGLPVPAAANLPRRSYFVGRSAEQEEILRSLSPGSRIYLVGIEGMGGVGKSALAVEVGYRCLDEGLFLRVVWVSTQQAFLTLDAIETEAPNAKTLVDIFLTVGEVLGAPSIGNLKIADQRQAVYSLLARQPTLLILDNFESLSRQEQSEVLSFLRKAPTSLKVILTSREHIHEGHIIQLQGLPLADSLSLLSWDAQLKNLTLSSAQQKKLIEITEGFPQAMLWVQAQVACLGYSIDHVLDSLYSGTDTLLVKYCFNRSWELLTLPASRQILLTLALHVDPASRNALQAINNLDDETCSLALSDLLQLSLIYHQADRDTFGILPITRRFLHAHFSAHRAYLRKAEWRMVEFYADRVSQHSSFQNWRSYADLLADRNNILNAAQWCHKTLRPKPAEASQALSARQQHIASTLIQMALEFGSVLWQRAFWYDRLALALAALDAAHWLNDWRSTSILSRNIAWIHYYQGDAAQALVWARRSLAAVQQVGEPLIIAGAMRVVSMVEFRAGNWDEAERLMREVIAISREHLPTDDYAYYSLAFAYTGMGDLAYERSEMTAARQWYQQALEIWRSPQRKDPVRHISYSLNGLGFVALREDEPEEARRCFSESIQAAEQVGRIEEAARGKLGMAMVMLSSNAAPEAGTALANEALEVFTRQGMQHEIAWAKNVLRQFAHKA